jgi:hypothetical protein
VVINEALIRPHYDWEGAGEVSTGDEFIELYNRGPYAVYLRDWMLDDVEEAGSSPYTIPGITISPGGFATFFRTRTGIALNDSGDEVRLLGPRGEVIDSIQYLRVRAYNLSYGRLPDGSNHLAYGLWPTPGRANLLFVEPTPIPIPTIRRPGVPRRACSRPATRPWRLIPRSGRRVPVVADARSTAEIAELFSVSAFQRSGGDAEQPRVSRQTLTPPGCL